LLIYVPLLVAIYMFVWPTLYRFLVVATNERIIPPFTNHIVTSEFWATFPSVAVAIPFLFICGFVTVYFLGSKGFCTYGCPYGGVFAVADKVAPGKIRVTDACNQCGQCTTTCMSNVNVAAEVAQYGMVVDPGCMKHMDCISVCPNDALYFGFGKPTILSATRSGPHQAGERSEPLPLPAGALLPGPGAIATGLPIASKPRTQNSKYSLTWLEEIAAALVFAGSLFAAWDVYQLVPMLMALGIAAVTTFLAYILWRLANAENVLFHRFPLKSAGSIRSAGWVFAGFALVWIGTIGHSGWVRYNEREGNAAFERVRIPDELALARSDPGQWLAEADREAIAVGTLHLYRAFDAGFIVNTFTLPKLAWLEYLGGKPEQAIKLLALAEKRQDGESRALSLYYRGAILNRLRQHEEALADLDVALTVRPDLITALEEKGESLWQMGRRQEAVAAWTSALGTNPNLPLTNYFLSGAAASLGRSAEAEAYEKHADSITPPDARFHWMLAMRLENVGMKRLANKHFARSIDIRPGSGG
jgi:tetratricopeptide (TPR) repeat protein/ferredoxin